MASEIKVDTISEKTSANGVTIDGVSLKDSKIATANSIDSDAYVDGSIDAVHMSADSIDSASYVDLSIDTAHIGATQVTGAKLNTDAISAQTALTAEPADTDEFMVSDAGVLKRIDYSLIKGGSNSSYFMCYRAANNTTPSASTWTAYIFDSAPVNDGSVYDTTTGAFTAPSAGRYYFESQFWASQVDDGETAQISHYFDLASAGSFTLNTDRSRAGAGRGVGTDQGPLPRVSTIADLASGDKVQTFVWVESGGIFANAGFQYMLGFKLA